MNLYILIVTQNPVDVGIKKKVVKDLETTKQVNINKKKEEKQ